VTAATTLQRRLRFWGRHGVRRAYTLIELVASIAATAILVAGMGSVVMVAARSTSESPVPVRQVRAAVTAQDILSELEYAVSFSERTATAVEFTVTDRNGDASVETIRYAWSGTPGDPLTRQYNGGTAVEFRKDIHLFSYSDLVETVTAYDGTETHHVYQCDLVIQVGDDSSAQAMSSVKAHNAPEVAAP